MDTPKILAIADVRISAQPASADRIFSFYTDLIGLDPIQSEPDEQEMMFQGYPRTGPRLLVSFSDSPREDRPRVLIEVASLTDLAEQMDERQTPYTWCRGWTFFDRRLCALDPAGNHVELVDRHEL